MKATERNELIRIIKGRVRLLRQEATVRAYEIYEAEQRKLNLAQADKIEGFRARAVAINEAAADLIDQAHALWNEVQKDQNLSLNGQVNGTLIKLDVRAYRPGLRYTSERVDPIVLHVKHELDRAELSMIEEILVGNFETEEAKKFLAKIPSVETLIEGKMTLDQIAR